MCEIDRDRTLSRDQWREQSRQTHDDNDADADPRAIVAEESAPLFRIKHPTASVVSRGWISELRRCVRRLTLPATVLPEILLRHDPHPLLEMLGESSNDAVHVPI